jgi:8-oxo-dGTP pyrophosphatase MutT (NUDIX family)
VSSAAHPLALNAPRHPPLISEPWLRERFTPLRAHRPVTTGDGHTRWRPDQLRRAAVLVPVVSRHADLTVLLTRRTAHLHDHAGQISFPGGRAEPHDPDAAATALRETEEETGIGADRIEILGALPEYVTVTGYRVTPVVGLVRAPFELRPDDFEVAEVFEVPLPFLLNPANHQRNAVVAQGHRRHYYAMPYRGYYIWGATAGMLMNLHAYLMAEE